MLLDCDGPGQPGSGWLHSSATSGHASLQQADEMQSRGKWSHLLSVSAWCQRSRPEESLLFSQINTGMGNDPLANTFGPGTPLLLDAGVGSCSWIVFTVFITR